MKTQRKILVISRHGKAPQKRPEEGVGSKDELVPESVTSIYYNTGVPLQYFVTEQGITERDTFLRHSDKRRTELTGGAILAGALRLEPRIGANPPTSQEDLANYSFTGVAKAEDSRLNYSNLKLNEDALRAMGLDAYIRAWSRNPDSDKMGGVDITPFNEVLERGRHCLASMLIELTSKSSQRHFGVAVTHGSIIEPTVMAAIGLREIVNDNDALDRIGGPFDMEESVQIKIDQNPAGIYSATIKRQDKERNVKLYRSLDLDEVIKTQK